MSVAQTFFASPFLRSISGIAVVSTVLLAVLAAAPDAYAQQKPGVERSVVNFERGNDIVQPPAVVYRKTTRASDQTIQTKETRVGTLMIPRPKELDAIEYRDATLGYAVNLQQAMVVRDGQVVDVPVSRAAAEDYTESAILEEAIVIRPPAADSFDVAVPDGIACIPSWPAGVKYVSSDVPCVQIPGEETVIDVRSWFRTSMTNALSGIRALPGAAHTARELRGSLTSTYHDRGESVRFLIVATAPSQPVTLVTRVDSVIHTLAVDATPVGKQFVFVPQATGFEWITTVGMMRGPNRADLPGLQSDRYRGTRLRGDVISTLRWNVSEQERYELSFFGGTNPTTSNHAVGDHHDVPYGLGIAARFGDPRNLALELRAEASYEDDPFQEQTFRAGDQRLRLLIGLDRGTLHVSRRPDALATRPTTPGQAGWAMQQAATPADVRKTHWRVSAGPTYYVDRVNLWEQRKDARELGYTVDGVFDRLMTLGSIRVLASTSGRLHQSWGYIQDSANQNFTVEGRASLKPVVSLGKTHLAFGPAIYGQHVDNEYAEIPGFTESNLQVGVELTSWISL